MNRNYHLMTIETLNLEGDHMLETHYTITRFYVRLTAVISMVLRTVKGG